MDYIPQTPFDSDPLRIVSLRRIQQELPAQPPEAPPEPPPDDRPPVADQAPPPYDRRTSSSIPDAAYWPNHPCDRERDPPLPGEGDHLQGGGGARSESPAAAGEQAPHVPPPSPAATDDPPPHAGEDERTCLMRAWLDKHWDLVEAMARADETPLRPSARPGPVERPKPPPPPPPIHVRKGDRWNKWKMGEFLRQLAATHSVSAAARAVGMHRRSAYKLRARLKGQPFDIAWEAAFRHGYDNLAHSALELALEGEEVPHYYKGELKGTHRKRSTQLIVQLLKMRNRAGAPMLGRYAAAAEWWGDRWDLLLARIETGAVDWSDEHAALGEAELAGLGLPDARREIDQLVIRNLPDERPHGHGR